MDDLAHGILSGILGPAVAKWLSRFRYIFVFLAGVFGAEAYLICSLVSDKGWKQAIPTIHEKIFTPAGLFIPIAIGVIAVFCSFLASIGFSKK
ncbi:hypothetical protein QZM22_16405 [Burkholderia oklahomensis]|uniref:MnhB domain-containing protein n=1 Tax=Burkholderia oklahomensis TaxID=342113 RepID=UPI0026526487|nr:MnhB domain-containing protein [Burkholderia oklahomensis]MDN7674064.1 hypothetical protein [Burkholderia oklahomensis]